MSVADAEEPDWVRYARKAMRWWPWLTSWALAEIQAWERAVALSRKDRSQ